ncbi:MAG TPA: TonB-dependent receptor [Allosphingosinicella sp.]|jgi:TonB-dependent receptor
MKGIESRQADARDRLGLAMRGGVSALALCMVAVAAPAFAQTEQPGAAQPSEDDAPPADEQAGSSSGTADPAAANDGEIVVTGIRQSLKSSQDIKRTSDVVVDSVTAEDIGALPDRSVTETLQRIPGVSINRFSAGRDPDHFSVEGSGVVVRGLTYVRSELNGRDTFTANNGRGLSFADVPSELLGGVDVFKSPSADMVEGGIAGVVNLRTRVPFDSKGLLISGSIEANYGDLEKEVTPTVSALVSNRWSTGVGEFGLLGSFVYSQLRSRADRIQISNFAERTLYSNGDVVPSAGATAIGDVYFPRGAVIGTQRFDRERYGYSGAAQWRSNDRSMIATFQFLRSDAREAWNERVVEIATDNVTSNGDSRAVPGTTLEFDDSGLFDNGVITGNTGWRDDQNNTAAWGGNGDVRTPRYGLQSNNQSRSVQQRFVTTDISGNFKWSITDNLAVNLDYQHVASRVKNLDAGLWTSSFQNVALDLDGKKIPSVRFVPPEVCFGPSKNSPCTDLAGGASDQNPSYFGTGHNSYADPYNTFFRSAMDHIEDSEGNQDSARIDLEYTFDDGSWIDAVKVGYRHADRKNVARFSAYNWGVLSEIWGGRGPVWLDDPVDGVAGGTGGAPLAAYEPYGFDNFFRGQAGDPLAGDVRLFYSGDPAQDYAEYARLGLLIGDEWRTRVNPANPECSQNWVPLAMRCGVPGADPFGAVNVNGSPFLPQEINPVREKNDGFYAMVRFGNDLGKGRLSGNVGLRYTTTTRVASGFQAFPRQAFSACLPQTNPETGQPLPPTPFCALPLATRQAAAAFANGALTPSAVKVKYDYLLPSLNVKYEAGGGLQFRLAYSKGIAPPDFGLTRNFYNIGLSTLDEDVLTLGGLYGRSTVGNPRLLPIRSDNFDATAEWYFSDVGQLTLSLFYKRLKGVLTNGTERLSFTNNGATFEAIVTTPSNSPETGKIKGFEIAYQQTYDFLPGPLSGLGLGVNYTFVDSSGVSQSTLSETDPDVAAGTTSNVDTSLLPLQGLSKHTFNITPFFEKGPLSLRLSYSWRSRFLLTVRDVIVPFAPIMNESTGQLDGSIFYSLTDKVKIGIQAVNILNEVTRTTQVLNDELQLAPRSWFMNDRRFSAIVRFTF